MCGIKIRKEREAEQRGFDSQKFYDSASARRGFGHLERGSFMGANLENSDAT
jgi:hypothetical protein